MPRFTNGIEIIVNGIEIFDSRRDPSANRPDRATPEIAVIPASLLRNGTNDLVVRLYAWGPLSGFLDQLFVGPDDVLRPYYEERTLLLGGFTTRNLLAENGKITAVLDLIDASYGDAVYDIVPLDFWWPPLGIREAFLADQQRRERNLPFYAERLLCYECHHALAGLRFYAKSGNEKGYQMVREIIQRKLAQACL